MRTLLKTGFLSILTLFLCAGLFLALFPWWGPFVLDRALPPLLERIGFSEVALSVEKIGMKELSVRVEQLRYAGVTLSNASVRADYHLKGLRRGELDSFSVEQAKVVVDLAAGGPEAGGAASAAEVAIFEHLPARFPIGEVRVDGAEVILKRGGLQRAIRLDLELEGRERLEGGCRLESDGLKLRVDLDGDWAERSGRAVLAAELDRLGEWVEFLRSSGGFSLPDGFLLSASPIQINGEMNFEDSVLADWQAQCTSVAVSASRGESRFSSGQVDVEASGTGAEIALSGDLSGLVLGSAAADLELKRLRLAVRGQLPDSLEGRIDLSGGRMTWADGGGELMGLEGSVALASLRPPHSKGEQRLEFTSIRQGELLTEPGQLQVSYEGGSGEGSPLRLGLEAGALGGTVHIRIAGKIQAPRSLSVHVRLDAVQLGEVAPLFPQFEGQVEGLASGELGLRLEGSKLVLRPGTLQMVSGTTGRFEYTRQGWLTQDPQLDPEAFVQAREILEIMGDGQGATILTELAVRDLEMTKFVLRVDAPEDAGVSVEAQIQGHRMIKGVKVPVVLDVPIRGDVEETINAVFEFNARL
ncbi:MAG: hypothetical protein ACLFU4_10180 [Opitutales bacterium]